jgi:hypothetical protein
MLLEPGDYPPGLQVAFPFSRLAPDGPAGPILVEPAYDLCRDLAGLTRIQRQANEPDEVATPTQPALPEPLAPDTVEAIMEAIALLEREVGRSDGSQKKDEKLRAEGRHRLEAGNAPAELDFQPVDGPSLRLLEPAAAWNAYRHAARVYAIAAILAAIEHEQIEQLDHLHEILGGEPRQPWIDLGGWLLSTSSWRKLIESIETGDMKSWSAVHAEYEKLRAEGPMARASHAWQVLNELDGEDPRAAVSAARFAGWLEDALAADKEAAEAIQKALGDSPADQLLQYVARRGATLAEQTDRLRRRFGIGAGDEQA